MSIVIKQAITSQRMMEDISELAYKQSYTHYKRLLRRDRRMTQYKSLINRVKMDWLYLKWKGWK